MILLGPTRMSNVDPAGRVQLTLDPALPSKCIICQKGSGGGTQFVDFDLSLDWYGAVVICADCIRECISVVESDPVAHFTEKLSDTKRELEVALSELERYRTAFDSLSFIRPDLNPFGSDPVVDSKDAEATDEGSGDDVPETPVGRENDESESDGPDSSGGLKNFSIFAD